MKKFWVTKFFEMKIDHISECILGKQAGTSWVWHLNRNISIAPSHMALPINVLLTYQYLDFELNSVSLSAVISFIYVGLISMYIGFFFWYMGIAIGGIARVDQVQLIQPFLTLTGAYFLLNEEITAINIGVFCVLAVVVLGKRTKAK